MTRLGRRQTREAGVGRTTERRALQQHGITGDTRGGRSHPIVDISDGVGDDDLWKRMLLLRQYVVIYDAVVGWT